MAPLPNTMRVRIEGKKLLVSAKVAALIESGYRLIDCELDKTIVVLVFHRYGRFDVY